MLCFIRFKGGAISWHKNAKNRRQPTSLRPCAAFAALLFNPSKNLIKISFTFYPLREYAIMSSP